MLTAWFLLVGLLLVLMALLRTVLARLPVSSAMIYLAIGVVLGPVGAGWIRIDPLEQTRLFEALTEVAVLISLFSVGLKLRDPFASARWRTPAVLATLTMILTIALIAVLGVTALGLSIGAAVLLGAILAPTDPVLASEVQLRHAADQDALRFALSAEGGMNDGSAFPFIMLGLGLLGLHQLGAFGISWFAVDVVWAVVAGVAVGWLAAHLIGHFVLHLRRHHHAALGTEEFLALGLIALAYGAALAVKGYGFLAVFAAGLAIRTIERRAPGAQEALERRRDIDTPETDPRTAPAELARSLLGFNEQLEKIVEFGVVLCLGVMLSSGYFSWTGVALAAALFFLVRPIAVTATVGAWHSRAQTALIAWFGIRGIGSIYYLLYAINHGVPEPLSRELAELVLTVLAVSIVVHGVSATPLMERYEARIARRAPKRS